MQKYWKFCNGTSLWGVISEFHLENSRPIPQPLRQCKVHYVRSVDSISTHLDRLFRRNIARSPNRENAIPPHRLQSDRKKMSFKIIFTRAVQQCLAKTNFEKNSNECECIVNVTELHACQQKFSEFIPFIFLVLSLSACLVMHCHFNSQ